MARPTGFAGDDSSPGSRPDTGPASPVSDDAALDRRDFLKRATVQTGLLAAGAVPVARSHPSPWFPARRAEASPEIVVIGAGAFGGWTSLHLQRLGAKVTMVDAWGPGNSRATSGDESRGVRSSYGDRPHGLLWGRWAREAIRRWKGWDEEWGKPLRMRLFHQTGDIIMRSSWESFLTETRKNWDQLGTPYEVLTPDEVKYRWSAIDVKGMTVVLHEPEAGVVRARRGCEAVAEVFRQGGGDIRIAWANPGSNAKGKLNDITMRPGTPLVADQFVFALGPWLGKMFPEPMGKRLRTPMGCVFYFGTPPGDPRFTYPDMPSWNIPGVTGWPALPVDNRGFRVRTGGGRGTDPDTSERWVDQTLFPRARQVLADRFPDMAGAPLVATHSCHYESSPSRNFIVDHHPAWSNVWIAGAGNAEGYKFGPVVGEYVARRVLGLENDPELIQAFRIPEETFDDQAANRATTRRSSGGPEPYQEPQGEDSW